MTKASEDLAAEHADILRDIIKPGDTLYTVVTQRASSGMSRHIEVVVPQRRKDGTQYIRNITRLVGSVAGFKVSPKTEALVVGGAGMDMGFHVVYSLSSQLYRDGFKCQGKGCPSNDHSNDFGEFSRTFRAENPELDADESQEGRTAYCSKRSDEYAATEKARYSKRRIHQSGGYALSQSWL